MEFEKNNKNDRGPRRDFDRNDRNNSGDRDRGPRRDFDRNGSSDRAPRRDFDRAPRRDFGGSGGDRGPRRDFDRAPRRDFGGSGDRGPRRDFNNGPRRDFGGSGDRGPRRDFGNAKGLNAIKLTKEDVVEIVKPIFKENNLKAFYKSECISYDSKAKCLECPTYFFERFSFMDFLTTKKYIMENGVTKYFIPHLLKDDSNMRTIIAKMMDEFISKNIKEKVFEFSLSKPFSEMIPLSAGQKVLYICLTIKTITEQPEEKSDSEIKEKTSKKPKVLKEIFDTQEVNLEDLIIDDNLDEELISSNEEETSENEKTW